ncbi:hypothetical protein [Duganella sp. Leaf126]|uniref:hypothetical protein n=1 Tax=Duganella sp. Leaf126 TaxID=1736266 RepID=UPI0012E321D3|nr:hypothetical protein [Duganella sp. Leaf126]
MSIAVSVVVRPSPGLRMLHAGLCCCVLASAAACPGVLAPLACVVAAVCGYVYGQPCSNAISVDITAVGQFRTALYQQTGTPLRLLDGSTVWRGLLLLRLGDEDGGVRSVLVLPDCVSGAELRALTLACRAAAARSEINTPTL